MVDMHLHCTLHCNVYLLVYSTFQGWTEAQILL